MATASALRIEVKNGAGLITLNSPETDNSLSLAVIREIDGALERWEKDEAVHFVLIRSIGDIFCSGVDLRALHEALPDPDHMFTRDYFREEYILNHRIYHFPKPVVSILNGKLRGDGLGLALFGARRIVTDKAAMILSETDIGFIVDGGATYLLSRFPGRTGLYAGLTGVELDAADAIYSGLGTHYLATEKLAALEEQLLAGGFEKEPAKALDAVLAQHCREKPGASGLEAQRKEIDACFSHASLEEMVYYLAEGTSKWHRLVLETLGKRSPTSLKATLRLIRAGRRLSFDAALQLEYRVIQHVLRHPDFAEGVRARVVEGDHQPHWQPDLPEAVSTAVIDRFFEPLPEGELRLKIASEAPAQKAA